MININCNFGEGGGQILRTSLSLAAITGQAIHLTEIRAKRQPPGLKRQHLTCVQAIAEITGAEVAGDKIGSGELYLTPKHLHGGKYYFAVGTAGCVNLIAQTVLPALLFADSPSEVTLMGGTHVSGGPMTDFFQRVYLPCLRKMGVSAEADLEKHGFFPAGGGKLVLRIQPCRNWKSLHLLERGPLLEGHLVALDCRLRKGIAQDELRLFQEALSPLCKEYARILVPECRQVSALSSGNALWAELQFQHITELFSTCGELNLPRHRVASRTAELLRDYCLHGAPVGTYLADQLMLPMAIGNGGEFLTGTLSPHSQTNLKVLQFFLDCKIHTQELRNHQNHVQIER